MKNALGAPCKDISDWKV